MTRFTVIWHQFAKDELLRLWLDNIADRRAITEAANTIDRELARDPDTKGKRVEDEEELRELFVRPLRVLYSYSEPDRMVEVAGVALL